MRQNIQRILSGNRITLPVWFDGKTGDFVLVKNSGNYLEIVPAQIVEKQVR